MTLDATQIFKGLPMARERNSSGKLTGPSLGQQKAHATHQAFVELTEVRRGVLVAKQERLKALRLAAEAEGITAPEPEKKPVRAKKSVKSIARVPPWIKG